jgi:hypothetical protein
MNTNEQPNPDQTGTWEPDRDKLADVLWDHFDRRWEWHESLEMVNPVVAAYRRQQAARGKVEVRRELLRECYHLLKGTDGGGIPELRQELAEAIARNLAAATEQP